MSISKTPPIGQEFGINRVEISSKIKFFQKIIWLKFYIPTFFENKNLAKTNLSAPLYVSMYSKLSSSLEFVSKRNFGQKSNP